jgi:hypothetical protein
LVPNDLLENEDFLRNDLVKILLNAYRKPIKKFTFLSSKLDQ